MLYFSEILLRVCFSMKLLLKLPNNNKLIRTAELFSTQNYVVGCHCQVTTVLNTQSDSIGEKLFVYVT